MYDKQKIMDKLHDCGVAVDQFCDKGDLDKARLWCDTALQRYRKARVDFTSNIADRWERENALLMAQGYFIETVKRLLRAYGEQSDVENCERLFRDALEEFKTATHKDIRETAESLVQASYGGFLDLVGYGISDGPFQETWFLEQIACLCYGIILAGSCLVRQYEEWELFGVRLRDRMEAAEQMDPTKAFTMFVNSYKALGKMYQDEGLQESALVFHEVDDVWRLNAEVRKLAERYSNKELRRRFLFAIATSASESILYYGKGGKSDNARATYEELTSLVEAHKEEEEEWAEEARTEEEWARTDEDSAWAHVRAKGAANLIYMLVNADQPDEARMVYHELRKLAEKRPDDANLLGWQVGGRASEIIYAYAKANRFDEARELYDELRMLAEDHSRKRDLGKRLRAWQANGAFYLTYAYFKAGMPDDARSMFEQLEEVAEYADDDLRQQKKDGMPLIDWLKQLLQKGNS